MQSAQGVAVKQPYDRVVRTEFKMLAQIRISDPAKPVKEIAQELGYSYQSVLTWLKNMDYQRYESWLLDVEFKELPRDVQATVSRVKEKYGLFAEEMQERLFTILDTTKDEKLQASIAQDLLDRAGCSAPKTTAERTFTIQMTPELLEMMERRARESRLLSSGGGVNGSSPSQEAFIEAVVESVKQG